MWDIIVLSVYLILSIILLWGMYGEEKGKVSHKALRILSVFTLITAVLVHTSPHGSSDSSPHTSSGTPRSSVPGS